MAIANTLSVSEFFYSLQGEGRTMGIPAIFLRLSGCNLVCGGQAALHDFQKHEPATWVCDTIAVWLKGTSYSFENLLERLNQETDFIHRLRNGAHLVITGGEPLLHQQNIVAFLTFLEENYQLRPIIEIETNATILPLAELDARVHYWNTSPKLANSGMPAHKRIIENVLAFFNKNEKTMFKFVLNSPADWEEIAADFVQKQGLNKQKLVLMPAASSIDELLIVNKIVADICIKNQVRMCSRLHVEIWNQLTGV